MPKKQKKQIICRVEKMSLRDFIYESNLDIQLNRLIDEASEDYIEEGNPDATITDALVGDILELVISLAEKYETNGK
jgi:hypothetical protein